MTKRKRIWLLIFILIIATFLRFYHLASTPPGLYPDEAMDGNNAVEVAQTGHFQVFYPEDNGREGLYVNILAVIFRFYPNYQPWVIRLPAAVAGVFTVWGIYLFLAEVLKENENSDTSERLKKSKFNIDNDSLALLSAFFLATSFWAINFSRIGFRAILSPLLLAWSFYFLIKAFRSAKTSSAYVYALIAGIVYSLGFYTYIAYRITPLLLLFFIPFYKKCAGFWKRTAIFVIVAFIVAIPIGFYFLQHPTDFFGRTSEISVTNASNPLFAILINTEKTVLMFNFHGDNNWRQNISGAPELFWPVGILFLLGIIVSIAWLKRKETSPQLRFMLWLMLGWFVLGLLPEIFSNEGIPHALRSLLAIIPSMFLAAIGGIWLSDFLQARFHKELIRGLGVLFIIIIAISGYYDYFFVWAKNPNVPGAFNANYVAIGKEINQLPTSTAKYVVVEAGGVLARGIPVPAETTMFITNTFTTSTQIAKNIHYLLPNQTSSIPAGTPGSNVFFIP
jgi:hypothetical protein